MKSTLLATAVPHRRLFECRPGRPRGRHRRSDDRPVRLAGDQIRKGAEMAIADINARGGVLGQKPKLEVGDDACDPKQAVSVAKHHGEQGHRVHARPLVLELDDPGLRGYVRGRHPDGHRVDQSAG